jgi:hypothetical protein
MTSTQDKKKPYMEIIIDFIKNELLESDFKDEMIKFILLYYIVPIVLAIVILNFISTIGAITIVLWLYGR